MTLLTLDGVACAAPDGSPLFSGLSLSLNREAVGLVGRNGSGKSTLLRAITGKAPLASGTIARGGTIGALDQLPPDGSVSLAEALGLAPELDRLARIEAGRGSEEDFAKADWTLPARLEDALAASGLPTLDLQRPLASLSGGERMRVMLAAMLLPEPDILLLDEPTNDLDAEGRQAVADLLAGWRGGALVASHDRELLRGMDRILELTPVGVHLVGGGWEMFDAQRKAERERAQQALERSEADLARTRRDRQREAEKQARRDRKGRSEAARGAEPKMLLHAEQQRAEKTAARYRKLGGELVDQAEASLAEARESVEQVVPIRMDLPPSGLSSSHVLLKAEGLVCRRGGRILFGPRDFLIRGPQRIALRGANGSGKTSLIRLILGEDRPAQGQLWADRERIALLDQQLGLLGGCATLSDAMKRHNPDFSHQEIHAALAGFGFRNRWAQREVASLSGGERMRLALACLFARREPPQMLILDEPTNHLDMAATEMLEQALAGYDGALICVSHDAAFMESLALDEKWDLGLDAV